MKAIVFAMLLFSMPGLTGACFDPSYPQGLPCDAFTDCPPDQRCVDRVCARAETCADGAVQPCGVGGCLADGTQICADGIWTACIGATMPSSEICDGVSDEDCDGVVDESPTCECTSSEMRLCGIGMCPQDGSQSCINGQWGECIGATMPTAETCDGVLDEDCDGNVDESPCICISSTTRACGTCGTGTQTCASGVWGPCVGAREPAEECNGLDDNCNGAVDESAACTACLNIGDILVHDLLLDAGDREFAGHGPLVDIETTYSVSSGRVCAQVTVTMRETSGGTTVGHQTASMCSAVAPGAIAAITTRNTVHSYTDNDPSTGGVWDFVTPSLNSGITTIRCVGDTGGDDICVGGGNFTDCSKCELLGVCAFVRY